MGRPAGDAEERADGRAAQNEGGGGAGAGVPPALRGGVVIEGPIVALALVAAVGCGLVGGVFFAFSSFVMPALGRLPPAHAVAAMQSINALAVTPAFMAALFGTALACVALVVQALVSWGDGATAWALAGGVLYVGGTVGVTIAANVPLNERLAALRPDDPGAAALWPEYAARWTACNHVRAVAALAAAAALIVALRAS